MKPQPVISCKRLQSREHVVHKNKSIGGASPLQECRVIHHSIFCPLLKRLQRKVVAIETCPFKSKEERVLYNLSCICTYPRGLHKELMELHNLLICLCHYLFSPKPVEPKPPSPLAVCESS